MARKIDPVIYQGSDGKLTQVDKPMAPALAKLAGDERVILLHSPRDSCVFFDPYDEYQKTRGKEPRYSDCMVLDLKEYAKLAKIYGGEVMGPGWFPRHVTNHLNPAPTSGLAGAMARCESAVDDLLAMLVLI